MDRAVVMDSVPGEAAVVIEDMKAAAHIELGAQRDSSFGPNPERRCAGANPNCMPHFIMTSARLRPCGQ